MLTTILRCHIIFRRKYVCSLGAVLLAACLCRTVGAQDGLEQCAATSPGQGQPAAPTFTVAANTAQYCPGAQTGYTCDPTSW